MATSEVLIKASAPIPEEEAERLLSDKMRGLAKPPVPVQEIAERLGITVIFTPLQNGVSGALINENGKPFMAVNADHHRNRQRFTIAHEIGHYWLEHGLGEHVDREFIVLRRDEKSSTAEDKLEIAANQFAAALLMPKEFMLREFVRLGKFTDEDVTRLALKYQVSELAFQLRLRNLGLLQPF
jgi:Zn-dependent peptidase ImmA (M78 family)